MPTRRLLTALLLGTLAGCGAPRGGESQGPPIVEVAHRRAKTRAAPGPNRELPPPEAAKACLAAARQFHEHGNPRKAILLYEQARQRDPQTGAVAHPLAVLYDQQGDARRAWAEFQKALSESPHDPDLLNDLACFYRSHGDEAEAEKCLRRAVARQPDHEQAWVNLGMLLGRQGRWDESREAFARAVGQAAAHSNVGVLMARAGRREQALAELRQALALDPALKPARAFLEYLESPPRPALADRYEPRASH